MKFCDVKGSVKSKWRRVNWISYSFKLSPSQRQGQPRNFLSFIFGFATHELKCYLLVLVFFAIQISLMQCHSVGCVKIQGHYNVRTLPFAICCKLEWKWKQIFSFTLLTLVGSAAQSAGRVKRENSMYVSRLRTHAKTLSEPAVLQFLDWPKSWIQIWGEINFSILTWQDVVRIMRKWFRLLK